MSVRKAHEADNLKAGRHADYFITTWPEPPLEEFLADLAEKLKLRDVVRFYKQGDEGTFLSMRVRRVPEGFTIQGKESLIDDVLVDLGLTQAAHTLLPETKQESKPNNDAELLGVEDHAIYRRCSWAELCILRPTGRTFSIAWEPSREGWQGQHEDIKESSRS